MRDRLPRVGLYTAIAAILAIAIFPFWWMIDTSLKQPIDIFGGVTFYPHNPTTSGCSTPTTSPRTSRTAWSS